MATNGFTVTPTSGQSGVTTISVSATSLTSDAERGVWIDITAGTITKRLLAFQDNAKHHLDVTPPRVYLPSTGGSATFHIDSDEEWVLTNQTTWATFSQLSGSSTSVTVSAGINRSVDTRSAMFMINTPNITGSVYVEQPSAASLNVTPNPVYSNSGASSTYMTITSNSGWTISTLPDWVTASQVSGTGNTTVVLYCTSFTGEGMRTGTITINYGDGSAYQIGIIQYGKYYLYVDPSTISLSQEAGNTTFSISANCNWSITQPSIATSIVPLSGTGSTNVTIYHGASTSTTQESETMYIHYGKESLSSVTSVTITQDPFEIVLEVYPSEITVPYSGGSYTAYVNANVPITVSGGESWVDATLYNNTISIEVGPSTSASSRTGHVYILNDTYWVSTSITITERGALDEDSYFKITATTRTGPLRNYYPEGLVWYYSVNNQTPKLYTGQTVTVINGTLTIYAPYVWDYAYGGQEPISAYISSGITSIGYGAFQNCTSLTGVTIEEGVTSIGDQAFLECTGVTTIVIPNSVTSLGIHAFLGCTSLTSVTISTGITSIGRRTFQGCLSLSSVTIPDNVVTIDEAAFSGCGRTTGLTLGTGVTTIGTSAFTYNFYLSAITIPNNVVTIGEAAFKNCWGANSIVIGDGVRTIGDYAFGISITSYSGVPVTSSTTSITIGNSVTGIGASAFSRQRRITEIVIPDSVTSIGGGAFSECTSLMTIYDYAPNPTLGSDVFYLVPGGGTFYYAPGVNISQFQSQLSTWTFVQM